MNLLFWNSSISFLITISVIWTNLAHVSAQDAEGVYRIGTGIADITGPPSGPLSGFLIRFVRAAGIYNRLNARSFLVESLTTGDAVVYVTCDLAMFDHALKLEILKKLRGKHGGKFTEKNVLISATHTHSGPSGYMQYQSYIRFESLGFRPANFWAIVDGVVESIEMAESTAVDGRIIMNKGVLDRNQNRREAAYNNNPDRGDYTSNTDQEMIQLKFQNNNGHPLGAFSWWPVLPISFNSRNNPFVSSDNRGVAAQLFDADIKQQDENAQNFVSAFCSSNQGDVIPFDHLGGDAGVEARIAETRAKATIQFNKAKELFTDADETSTPVTGPIRFLHQYVKATDAYVTVGEEDKYLCKAALGYGFIASNPGFAPIYDGIFKTSQELKDCQAPKMVAIPTGELTTPWDWAPSIFSTQILQIGNVDIVALPGDFTTMAGRRVRKAVQAALGDEQTVVLAGLANNYISYVATPEEYNAQMFEGDATIYGPNTLPVFVKLYGEMATALNMNEELPGGPGPAPPNFIARIPGPDAKPDNNLYSRPFGAPIIQPPRFATYGTKLTASFVGVRPRNVATRGGSYFVIEKQQDDGETWKVARTDSDLDTTFYWNPLLRHSEVHWTIPNDPELLGTYRVRIFGHAEVESATLGNKIRPYTGVSNTFEVITQA